MLCISGLGLPDVASEFQKRYLRFKVDESAQTLTGPYLRAHLEDNIERQSIHEHVSASEAKQKSSAAKYDGVAGRAKDSD
jgi:hypothetical protein